jgi:predicted nucleic acid-binding Zn ribbon protein
MSDNSSRNPPWLDDEPQTTCGGCSSKFTMLLRRVNLKLI